MCVLFQSILMFTRHQISMMVYCKPTFIYEDFISRFTGDKLVQTPIRLRLARGKIREEALVNLANTSISHANKRL